MILHPDLMPAVYEAQRVLHLNQQQLADLVGSSKRTVQRWVAHRGGLYAHHVTRLAVAVHPRDPELARRLAAILGQTLESLGLVVPPAPAPVAPPAVAVPAPAKPPEPSPLLPLLVESVVSAAAEALDVSPRVARPAVLAAVERAKAAALTVDDLLAALRPPAPPPAPAKRARS
jgi:hypothetical protein